MKTSANDCGYNVTTPVGCCIDWSFDMWSGEEPFLGVVAN